MNSSLLELQELAATDLDLSLTGFDPKEIDDLRAGAQTAEGLTDEDAVPEVPEGWLGRKANGTAPPNAGAAQSGRGSAPPESAAPPSAATCRIKGRRFGLY